MASTDSIDKMIEAGRPSVCLNDENKNKDQKNTNNYHLKN